MTRRGTKTARVVTFLYASVLMVVSLLPSGNGAPGGWDRSVSPTLQNVLHVPAYGVLVALVTLCLPRPAAAGLGGMVVIAAICGAFGTAMEFTQAFVPGRMGSVPDVLLNLAGVALGALAVVLWRQAHRTSMPSTDGVL